MGCCPNRLTETKENSFKNRCEKHVIEGEEILGINRVSSKNFVNYISRYTHKNKMNGLQLRKALSSAGIDTEFLKNEKSIIVKFYKKFESFDRVSFSPLLLKTLGVLMGNGSLTDKASSLFVIYDEDCSKRMESIEFKSMIEHVLLISIDYCIDFAIECKKGRNEFELREYKSQLRSQKEKVFNYFKHILMYKSDSITKDNFVAAVKEIGVRKLFSTEQIRDLAYEYVSTSLN